jgi:hypothetical protein
MPNRKATSRIPIIAGERRADKRYTLLLDLRWKLVRRRRVLESGTGHTLDLSSSGILLDAGRHLPEGLNLELSVSWPVLLHNVAPLQLSVSGRIVRSEGSQAAIQMVQHEFRTARTNPDQPSVLQGASTKLLTRVISINGLGKRP